MGLGTSSSAPAGAQAQCLADDVAVLTAAASSTAICAGSPLTLTATAVFPSTRRMRNTTTTALPDGATAFTDLPVYSTAVTFGSTLQHGLENAYRNYSDLTGVRVRLAHAQPSPARWPCGWLCAASMAPPAT